MEVLKSPVSVVKAVDEPSLRWETNSAISAAVTGCNGDAKLGCFLGLQRERIDESYRYLQ